MPPQLLFTPPAFNILRIYAPSQTSAGIAFPPTKMTCVFGDWSALNRYLSLIAKFLGAFFVRNVKVFAYNLGVRLRLLA